MKLTFFYRREVLLKEKIKKKSGIQDIQDFLKNTKRKFKKFTISN